jgi:hypothetical protein
MEFLGGTKASRGPSLEGAARPPPLREAQEQGVRIDSGVQLPEGGVHGTDQVRSDGMGEANTPRGGRATALGIARAGRGHAVDPHDAGLHHGGRQPARRARPELPARLLAAGWHARHGLRVLERLALVRRRLRIQPRVGLRAIPGDPVQWPAGPDHELRPTLRGPDGHVLGRALLGSALSRPPLVPPASAARMGHAAPAAAASQASIGVGASAPTAAFRKPAATARPSSLGSAAGGSAGQQSQVRSPAPWWRRSPAPLPRRAVPSRPSWTRATTFRDCGCPTQNSGLISHQFMPACSSTTPRSES